METLKCIKCGEDAFTNKEFMSGKCRLCGGELEEEKGDETTECDMGYYYDDF